MMSKLSMIRASLLATLMALPLAGLAVLTLSTDAVAQSAGGWRKEVADKLTEAQAAAQKGNFTEAIRLLKEAKAKAPLSPQEEHGVNEYLIYAASSAKDHKLVLATVDERLATGRVTGADLGRKLRLKATTQYSLRDYRGAAATFTQLGSHGGLTADDLAALGGCQMQLRDFRAATTTFERAISATEKAGKGAKTGPLLLNLYKAYFETGNDAKRMETLHRLMAVAPSTDVFKWVVNAYEQPEVKDPVVTINVYRLGASRGLLSKEHYAKYAEAALDMSSPGEAVAMLEKGMANGAIKKDDRNNRLLTDAKAQVERLKATLPQLEKEAPAIAIGEPSAKLATAYFTLKNYAKASEAAKSGLTKGKLRRPDDVQMLLGIALFETKKGAEAKNAFKAAAAANAKVSGVANLWSSVAG
jgi:tetratricopeptide (TPR) repeat protein